MSEQEAAQYAAWQEEEVARIAVEQQERQQRQHEATCAALAISREVYA